MTDIHARDEHQVIDLARARAAMPAPAKLTAELFEADGIPVADTARDFEMTWSGTKSSLPGGLDGEVLRQGAEAMARLSTNRSRDWADWLKVLAALKVGRHTAMLEAETNKPRGRGYCIAFAKWLRCHEVFEAIDQADRKRMFDCLDNLSAIEEWRAGLSPAQVIKWNYPPTVLREWEKSRRPPPDDSNPPPGPPAASEPPTALLAPKELRRQLELLGLPRFRREVMPEDWFEELFEVEIAFATPERLITELERKFSSSKAASLAFKMLRKSLRPVA
jgi:hypothetical protein